MPARWKLFSFLAVMLLATTAPALAVTAGSLDTNHPYIGYIVPVIGDQCTGAEFVGETVLLVDTDKAIGLGSFIAAARDAVAADSNIHVFVSFDPTDPYACDPTNTFLRSAVPVIGYSVHPDLDTNANGNTPHDDIGVLFLDLSSASPGFVAPTPAPIPAADDTISFIARSEPRKAVGYGPARLDSNGNSTGFGQPRVDIFDLPRRFAFVTQEALSPDGQLVAIDQSQDDDACFGSLDSGNIVLIRDLAAPLSILAPHGRCLPGAWGQRLDTHSVRAYLATQGIPVPGF